MHRPACGQRAVGQRRPWLLIDPKPYVGDPHYDVLQHLLNCDRLLDDPIGLVRESVTWPASTRPGSAVALGPLRPGR